MVKVGLMAAPYSNMYSDMCTKLRMANGWTQVVDRMV